MSLLVFAFFVALVLHQLLVLAVDRDVRPSRSLRQKFGVKSKDSQQKSRTQGQRHCTTCQFPKHSWDTFPVSFHSGRPNTYGPTGLEWLPEDLEALSRYPLITLEKWHGSQAFSTNVCNQTGNCNAPSNIFYWEQDAWVSAATQLKAKNPNISVAVWMDTMLIYTGWTWPPPPSDRTVDFNRTLNPDIKAPCTTGYFRPAEFLESNPDEYLLMNSSGMPALEPWSYCHIYDHTKARVREYWRDMCLNLTASGVIDGCGADFSSLERNRWGTHTTDYIRTNYGLDEVTAQAWNEGHRQMMVETTEALGEGGFLIGKDSFELGDHVNAVLQEGCPASNTTINMLRNLTATAERLGKRLIYQCHTNIPTESVQAAFLCGAGKDHYMTVGGWKGDKAGFPSHWIPEFEKPLGEPMFDCIYDRDSSMWSRLFQSGTHIWFNPTNNAGGVIWNTNTVHDS
ncbi:glycosyl hydrolase family 15-related protein [Nitzschia inconspicua]|uniref:Glycosyl hydrolase family 15-related protein n=1 Tax=Nitzschia inconspicua TaxID=303405 RepID=A0A9K3PN58_9STRA|nr:glycosyl hydrolase family 15-related protein [Nitzschia inconspicua]